MPVTAAALRATPSGLRWNQEPWHILPIDDNAQDRADLRCLCKPIGVEDVMHTLDLALALSTTNTAHTAVEETT